MNSEIYQWSFAGTRVYLIVGQVHRDRPEHENYRLTNRTKLTLADPHPLQPPFKRDAHFSAYIHTFPVRRF